MRVLVVEDEAAVADSIRTSLERGGFTVDIAADGEQAWFLGDTEDFSAAILDLGLPRLDGLSVLKRWRSAGRQMPVIVLTARGTWMERVEGIDAGADDYLPKPFQMEELNARLHAVLRRASGQSTNVQALGRITIDHRRRSVSVDAAAVDLTPLEFRLMATLAAIPETVLSATALLDQVYGHDHDKDTNTLEALLMRLRRKIGTDLIGTKRGQGYFLKAGE
jgi:two-component system, OmpR family, response regulator